MHAPLYQFISLAVFLFSLSLSPFVSISLYLCFSLSQFNYLSLSLSIAPPFYLPFSPSPLSIYLSVSLPLYSSTDLVATFVLSFDISCYLYLSILLSIPRCLYLSNSKYLSFICFSVSPAFYHCIPLSYNLFISLSLSFPQSRFVVVLSLSLALAAFLLTYFLSFSHSTHPLAQSVGQSVNQPIHHSINQATHPTSSTNHYEHPSAHLGMGQSRDRFVY